MALRQAQKTPLEFGVGRSRQRIECVGENAEAVFCQGIVKHHLSLRVCAHRQNSIDAAYPQSFQPWQRFPNLNPVRDCILERTVHISASGVRFMWPTIAMSASQPARTAEKANCTRLPENHRTLTLCDRTY